MDDVTTPITLIDATDCAAAAGIAVEWTRNLPYGWRGAWDARTRTIWLSESLSERFAIPALMHELAHAYRGDRGPQDAHVERTINRAVAARLILPADYARAEHVAGPSLRAVSRELAWPEYLVDAYRDTLRQ